jgi:hypothetical protein
LADNVSVERDFSTALDIGPMAMPEEIREAQILNYRYREELYKVLVESGGEAGSLDACMKRI